MAYLEHKSERKCSPAAPLGVDDQWWGGRAAGGPRSQRGTVVSHELAVVAELWPRAARPSRTQILRSAQCMKKAEFSITVGSDVHIDQDSCAHADWFLNRIVRQQQSTHVRTDHSSHTGKSTMHRSSEIMVK